MNPHFCLNIVYWISWFLHICQHYVRKKSDQKTLSTTETKELLSAYTNNALTGNGKLLVLFLFNNSKEMRLTCMHPEFWQVCDYIYTTIFLTFVLTFVITFVCCHVMFIFVLTSVYTFVYCFVVFTFVNTFVWILLLLAGWYDTWNQ